MAPKSTPNGDSKTKSKSHKANLVFAVSKEAKHLRREWKGRVAAKSPVYLAALLEFVACELLQAAGDLAKKGDVKRITPALLSRAIREDEDLHKLLGGARIFAGDKVEGIAKAITHPDDVTRAAARAAAKVKVAGSSKKK
tara:strand:- start:637 stop:1056 length:420 start_codon:yes stop_codon:yes gene_type:complete